jgi:hypothetical protein
MSVEPPNFKKQKVHLVSSLLGCSHEAKTLISKYQQIIRILPKEFDLRKMERQSQNIKFALPKPHTVFKDQARYNAKH